MPKNDINDVAQSPLDEIKAVEATIRKATLIMCLSNLKYTARKIKRYKALISANLKELGMTEAEAKQVIDFINESSDVKLTEEDLKKTAQDSRDFIKSLRKEAEDGLAARSKGSVGNKEVYNNFFTGTTMPLSNPQWTVTNSTGANTMYATSDGVQLTDSNGKSLNLKV